MCSVQYPIEIGRKMIENVATTSEDTERLNKFDASSLSTFKNIHELYQ